MKNIYGKNIGIRNGSSFHLTESFKSESAEAAGFCRVVQAYTSKLKNCKRMREYLWWTFLEAKLSLWTIVFDLWGICFIERISDIFHNFLFQIRLGNYSQYSTQQNKFFSGTTCKVEVILSTRPNSPPSNKKLWEVSFLKYRCAISNLVIIYVLSLKTTVWLK